ncbi:MAG: hypothetical protein WA960_01770 [Tunicatimonas sp.]
MKTVYIVHHLYEFEGCDETKLIGVYTSKDKAQAAIDRLKTKKGFSDKPHDFHLNEFELDQDIWKGGFSVWATIHIHDTQGNLISVQAECLNDELYRIAEDSLGDAQCEFHNNEIVECIEKEGKLIAIKLAGEK